MQVGLPGTTTSEINVAPMIDVLLVLLVIFMIAQTLLQVIPLHVPAPVHPAGPPPPAIVLELGKDHTYRINGRVVRKSVLPDRLRALFAGRESKLLFIRTESGWKYREVIEAADIARGVGVAGIAYMP